MVDDISITLKDKFVAGVILFMLIVSFIVAVYVTNRPGSDTARVDRIEHLIEFDTYYLFDENVGINDKMPLEDIKAYYNHPEYATHKQFALKVALDYVCDGTGEEQIESMMK